MHSPPQPLLSLEQVEHEVVSRDREVGNAFAKDLQIVAIHGRAPLPRRPAHQGGPPAPAARPEGRSAHRRQAARPDPKDLGRAAHGPVRQGAARRRETPCPVCTPPARSRASVEAGCTATARSRGPSSEAASSPGVRRVRGRREGSRLTADLARAASTRATIKAMDRTATRHYALSIAPLWRAGDFHRSPFPLIADYAFLSDCESTCLVAPSGAVEWMCVPAPGLAKRLLRDARPQRRQLPVGPVRRRASRPPAATCPAA